jgi:hypothetical protein
VANHYPDIHTGISNRQNPIDKRRAHASGAKGVAKRPVGKKAKISAYGNDVGHTGGTHTGKGVAYSSDLDADI